MKEKRKLKSCRLCGGKRVGQLTICYKCFLKRERLKRELKLAKLKERKKKRIEKNHNSYNYLNKLAWKLFSKMIRMEGIDEKGMAECYTCGIKVHYKNLQAGHFWHNKLDFDRRNIHKQCVRCNKWLRGNLAVYGTKLAQELGIEGMKKLDQDAHQKVYSWLDLKQIINQLERVNEKIFKKD